MRIVDNRTKCNIYNASFFADLQKHKIQDDGTSLSIQYESSTSLPISLNLTDILSLISTSVDTNVWTPAIISGQTFIKRKPILGKVNIKKPILGIDEAVRFPARFKSWTTSVDLDMKLDWRISNEISQFIPEYGIMYWYKKLPSSTQYFDKIPVGATFKLTSPIDYMDGSRTIPTSALCQKINNQLIKLANNNSVLFNNDNTVSFQYTSNNSIFDLDFTIYKPDTILVNLTNEDSKIEYQGNEYALYISDGEAFSYYESDSVKHKYIAKGICSQTYVSPVIWHIYEDIYHSLTYFSPKILKLDKHQTNALQKLCHFLSTAPQFDKTTLDILKHKDIYDSVVSYVNNMPKTGGVNEIQSVKTIIDIIYHTTYNYHIDTKNVITTKKQLYERLVSKYNPRLNIDRDVTISFNDTITNGPNVLLSSLGFSTYDVNTPTTTTLYNNTTINLGNIKYETVFSDTESYINLNNKKFYLTDSYLTPLKETPVSVSDIAINWGGPATEFNPTVRNSDLPDASMALNSSVTWSVISGKNAALEGPNDTWPGRIGRGNPPDVFIYESGTYEFQITTVCEKAIKHLEYITISTRGADTQDPTELASASTSLPEYQYNKIICSNIRSLAFGKAGLVWFIDSDHYIDPRSNQWFEYPNGNVAGMALKDTLVGLVDTIDSVQETNAQLSMSFFVNSGDTQIDLDLIDIQNMRDNSYDLCNCKSFHIERFFLNRFADKQYVKLPSKAYLNSPGSLTVREYKSSGATNENTDFILPGLSTKRSPPFLAYGGYDKQIIETLGINIPHHPQPKTSLPKLEINNEVQNPTGIACFLTDVPISGAYVSGQKCLFIPDSGLVKSTDPRFSDGISYANTQRTDTQKTFCFKGLGISNIRPSQQPFISTIDILGQHTSNKHDKAYDVIYGNYSFQTGTEVLDDDYYVSGPGSVALNLDDKNQISYTFYDNNIDTLKIQDIEIELDFLNYVNIKNLSIWLEIIPSDAVTNTRSIYKYANSGSDYALTDLNNYMTNLQEMNLHNRIYLLNGDYVSSHKLHSSIKFTNHLPHKKLSYPNSIVDYTDEYIADNGCIKLKPTLSAMNYSDHQICQYKMIIEKNQITDANNNFTKFAGTNLKNCKFKLHILPINPLVDSDSIKDNLLINYLSSKSFDKNKRMSSVLSSSLASWKLIIHTSKNKEYHNKDILGQIDYLNKNPVNGYNYALDLSNRQYLLPNLNKNAPFDNVRGVRNALFSETESDITLMFNYSNQLQFPSLMPYLIIGMAGFGTLTLLGSMAGLSAVSYALAAGGWADPIVSYLWRLTELRNLADINENYYRNIYQRSNYGRADRVVINFTQDKIKWYYAEVPIFRYRHTPILKPKQYLYRKLISNHSHDNIAGFLFDILADVWDIDLGPITHTTIDDDNEIVLSGLSISNNSDIELQENDLIKITTGNNKGYYLAKISAWVKLPSFDTGFLQYWSIDPLFTSDVIATGRCIRIDGTRAYNFFDRDENVSIGTETYTISGKCLFTTNTGSVTVLILDTTPTSSSNYIYKNSAQSNNILLYGLTDNDINIIQSSGSTGPSIQTQQEPSIFKTPDSASAYDIGTRLKYSSDSTTKPKNAHNTFSCFAEGAIGQGNDAVYPYLYNNLLFSNDAIDTEALYTNSQVKYNNLTFTSMSGTDKYDLIFTTTTSTSDAISMYGYSIEDFGIKSLYGDIQRREIYSGIINLANKVFPDSPISIEDIHKKTFLELKSDKFLNNNNIPESGIVEIQHDLYTKENIIYLDQASSTSVLNRINVLPDLIQNAYINYTTSASIDKSCLDKTTYDSNACNKTELLQQYKNLVTEYNSLKLLLQISTSDNGIYAHKIAVITIGDDQSISYNLTDTDYYWLHLDPQYNCTFDHARSLKLWVGGVTNVYGTAFAGVTRPGVFAHFNPYGEPYFAINTPESPVGDNISGVHSTVPTRSDWMYVLWSGLIEQRKQEIQQSYPPNTDLQWPTGDISLASSYSEHTPGSNFYFGGSTITAYSNYKRNLMPYQAEENNDYVMLWTEDYIRPTDMPNFLYPTYKIEDVVDFSKPIYFGFRNIPRKITNIDATQGRKFFPDKNGILYPKTLNVINGPIQNNLICWQCIDRSGEFIETPDVYKNMNEIYFRGFFNSVDGVENKNSETLDNMHPYEWVPYEYGIDAPIYTTINISLGADGKYQVANNSLGTINLTYGNIYRFVIDAPGHPFAIHRIGRFDFDYIVPQPYTVGVEPSTPTEKGEFLWEVPFPFTLIQGTIDVTQDGETNFIIPGNGYGFITGTLTIRVNGEIVDNWFELEKENIIVFPDGLKGGDTITYTGQGPDIYIENGVDYPLDKEYMVYKSTTDPENKGFIRIL